MQIGMIAGNDKGDKQNGESHESKDSGCARDSH
jgi:hypothetical protein